MKYYLVKEKANWADEFDIQGFKLFKSESIINLENQIIDSVTVDEIFPTELYFGTNEWQEYESREDLLRDLEIIEISETQYMGILYLFPYCEQTAFGTTAILK